MKTGKKKNITKYKLLITIIIFRFLLNHQIAEKLINLTIYYFCNWNYYKRYSSELIPYK